MSQTEIQLRYDGPEVQAHEMDVSLLGPSLIAFGELCEASNQILNGPETKVRVMLKADVKANCVTIDFHLVQTVWQQASALINNQNIATAKEILEWLGIISGGGTISWATVRGLIEFLKWKKDRKEKSAELERSKNGNLVVVQVFGDNNKVVIPEQLYKLSKSTKVVESLKALAQPISEETGIHKATFIHNKKDQLQIDTTTAKQLKQARADSDETEPQTFTAHITVHGVTFDSKSKHWKFKMNNRVENLDISETTIAEDAMKRGGVWVGDTYKVQIEMREHVTPKGEYRTDFKVKEVLDFRPGERRTQATLL